MRTKILILAACLLMGLIVVGESAVCPDKTSCPVPFVYDANQVAGRVIGAAQIPQGATWEGQLTACDPDGDKVTFSETSGAAILTVDGKMTYMGVNVGTYYFVVRVTDVPVVGPPLYDEGTIVVKVLAPNKPPVFTGCK